MSTERNKLISIIDAEEENSIKFAEDGADFYYA